MYYEPKLGEIVDLATIPSDALCAISAEKGAVELGVFIVSSVEAHLWESNTFTFKEVGNYKHVRKSTSFAPQGLDLEIRPCQKFTDGAVIHSIVSEEMNLSQVKSDVYEHMSDEGKKHLDKAIQYLGDLARSVKSHQKVMGIEWINPELPF